MHDTNPNIIEQKIEKYTIIIEQFNPPLTLIDRTKVEGNQESGQKT